MLPLLADSFGETSAKAKIKAALLGQLVNSHRKDWVANHNLAAAMDLVRIQVRAGERVLPWDWPALISPLPPKASPTSAERTVAYVGQVLESKGVGDLIEAVALLNGRAEGPRWRATIAGGMNEALARKAEDLGVGPQVAFVGRMAHERIVPLMNEHDVVVVPSWQEYPEGLPMTLYEALCSRTPLVASDHRMFTLKVIHEENALIFPAKQPAALAECLDRVTRDAALYGRLSRQGDVAAANFFCPLKFDQLISLWLDGSEQSRRKLVHVQPGERALRCHSRQTRGSRPRRWQKAVSVHCFDGLERDPERHPAGRRAENEEPRGLSHDLPSGDDGVPRRVRGGPRRGVPPTRRPRS